MLVIRASARYAGAVVATAELLEKLRVESVFVGEVARAAWLEGPLDSGAVDVLALMNAPQKGQLAMMASHRGYRVEREEIDRSEELDLVPLNFIAPQGDVRVHVLLASNALYARMVKGGVDAELALSGGDETDVSDRSVRVVRAEDLALMAVLSEDDEVLGRIERLPGFDGEAFEEQLISIGLGSKVGME